MSGLLVKGLAVGGSKLKLGGGLSVVSLQSSVESFTGASLDVTVDEVDISQTMLLTEWRGIMGTGGYMNSAVGVARLIDSTTLRIERNASFGTMAVHWSLIEVDGASVQNLYFEQDVDTKTITIDPVDLSRTYVLSNGFTSNTVVQELWRLAEGVPFFELISETELESTVRDQTYTEDVAVQVVQLQ